MSSAIVTRNKTRSGRSRRPTRARLGGTGRAVGKYVEDAASLGVRTLRGLNQLRKLINVETKVINTNSGSTNYSTSGVVTCLSQVAQGTDYTSRVGDSIRIQNMEVRVRIFHNVASNFSVHRCIIFRDLDGYGTAPTATDLLDAGTASSNAIAQYNWLNRDRFSILFDDFITTQLVNETSCVVAFKAAHEGHVKYLGTAAAAASNGKGSIYLLMISDETVNLPNYQHNSRVTFTDN